MDVILVNDYCNCNIIQGPSSLSSNPAISDHLLIKYNAMLKFTGDTHLSTLEHGILSVRHSPPTILERC